MSDDGSNAVCQLVILQCRELLSELAGNCPAILADGLDNAVNVGVRGTPRRSGVIVSIKLEVSPFRRTLRLSILFQSVPYPTSAAMQLQMASLHEITKMLFQRIPVGAG